MTLKLAWANVRRSYKDFALYFITLLVGVAVFYAFNSIEAQRGVLALSRAQGQMIEMLGLLTNIVSVLITVIMAFLVVYASRFLIKRRNKEFGLYLLLGMQRGRLLRLTAAETLMVGLASLGAGLLLGVGLSQVLVWATAFMFQANMNSAFTFLFAPEVAVRTMLTFCAIFAVSLLINVGYLMRAKLVDLINADRKNEVLTLRSIPLSFALFAASCAIIGLSYHLLLENGLLTADSNFWIATVLVCVGTLLFFYSLSGFLLRLVQLAKPLYYRGLNMVVLRRGCIAREFHLCFHGRYLPDIVSCHYQRVRRHRHLQCHEQRLPHGLRCQHEGAVLFRAANCPAGCECADGAALQ